MTMHARLFVTFLTLAGLLREAHAEDIDGVVAIGGTVEARDLATITATINALVRETAWQTPSKPLTKKEIDDLLRCGGPADLASCFPAALTKRGARRALVVTAEKQQATDGGLVVVLTGRLAISEPPQVLVQLRRCEPCTDDALAVAATSLGKKLLDELAVRMGRTLIAVTSNPQGADIVLDGERIGATPMTVKTFPGLHVIQIEKPGRIAFRRELEATDGGTVDVTADLQSATSAAGEQGKRVVVSTPAVARTGWWRLPAAFVAGGGILAVGGVTALYLGQQDGPDDKTRYTRATPIGIGALVVGVAVAGYGAFRLWRGPGPAPVIAPAEHGAVAGLAGRF